MEVFEITGNTTGVSQAGVNFLQPMDAYQNLFNGFIYRQVLQSRQGASQFAPRLSDESRITGIFEHNYSDPISGVPAVDLLVFDRNFLYKFNTSTGVFDQVAFGGSMAAYTGFDIQGYDQYISGVSYSDKDGNGRFVFCCPALKASGASKIFFYDNVSGTVKNYLSVVDNPQYAAPTSGTLTSATFVVFFNQRLNFIIPTISGLDYNQGTLYSGIKDSSGNGDKFNVAGSGLFVADTQQNITGCIQLGQILVQNYERGVLILEKSRDAFNPYFGRFITGVLGTNANFSPVSWGETIRSLGKTGILATDGRQNLRIDNKIPYFTENEVDQALFNLIYGGFDRVNSQFLWSYPESGSDTDTQNAVLVNDYEENTWSIYDQRFTCFGQTNLGINFAWDDIDETSGNASWVQWDTTDDIWNNIGLSVEVQKTLAGDDLGFIYQLNTYFDDYFTTISNIVPGSTTTLTVSPVGILVGDKIAISNVEGMTEINNFDNDTNLPIGEYYEVISATPTSIEIQVDSTNFSAYTTGGIIQKPIQFYAETVPFNPYRQLGKRVYVGFIEVLIDNNGANVYVDVYQDEEETPFIQGVLLQTQSESQEREWVSMTVNQEANFLTFVFRQDSPAFQIRITSIRIHAQPGGNTNG